MFFWICLLVVGAIVVANLRRRIYLPADNKVVVISGCDTGFGNIVAKALGERGCTVLAGCFTNDGIQDLKKSKNIIPLILDISKEESIDKFYEEAKQHCPNGVWALINNAGISKGYTLELTPVSFYKDVMEVNFFGHVAITKKFIPQIRKAQGRIVNMSSIAGRVATATMGTYCSSKFAMHGWTIAIREEMQWWGVKVSLIEPGFMRTPIVGKDATLKKLDDIQQLLNPEQVEFYGKEWFTQRKEHAVASLDKIQGDPQQVVQAYIHATLAAHPKENYLIGNDALIGASIAALPGWISRYIWLLIKDPNMNPNRSNKKKMQ